MGYRKLPRERKGFLVYSAKFVWEEDEVSSNDKDQEEALKKAIVQISTGKWFYVDPASRGDISEAISIGEDENQVTTLWKLAVPIDGTKWHSVTLAEMKEARKKGLELKGSIIS